MNEKLVVTISGIVGAIGIGIGLWLRYKAEQKRNRILKEELFKKEYEKIDQHNQDADISVIIDERNKRLRD